MPRSRVSSEEGEGDSEPEVLPPQRTKQRPVVRSDSTPKIPLGRKMKALALGDKPKTKIPEAKPAPNQRVAKDIPIGYVYLKAGRTPLWETPSRKYYTLRDNGTRNYLTARVESSRLAVYDEK